MTTAQQQQNEELETAQVNLAPKDELLHLIEKNTKDSLQEESFNPIENAMKRHPDLTSETAEKMAKAFGF